MARYAWDRSVWTSVHIRLMAFLGECKYDVSVRRAHRVTRNWSQRTSPSCWKGGNIVERSSSNAVAMLKIMRLIEKKRKAKYEKRYKASARKVS